MRASPQTPADGEEMPPSTDYPLHNLTAHGSWSRAMENLCTSLWAGLAYGVAASQSKHGLLIVQSD